MKILQKKCLRQYELSQNIKKPKKMSQLVKDDNIFIPYKSHKKFHNF